MRITIDLEALAAAHPGDTGREFAAILRHLATQAERNGITDTMGLALYCSCGDEVGETSED